MTDTIARPSSGAVVNPNAYAEAQDFLPLKGLDHVEWWVGNARAFAVMKILVSVALGSTLLAA